MMMWNIVWSKKKTGKAKLWKSICLVIKSFRTVSSDVVWPFKNFASAKIIQKKRPNSAKMLKKLSHD